MHTFSRLKKNFDLHPGYYKKISRISLIINTKKNFKIVFIFLEKLFFD